MTRMTKANCHVVAREPAAKALHAVKVADTAREIANRALRSQLTGLANRQPRNRDQLRQRTRPPVVAVRDLLESPQNFRIFQPGKKQSAVWQFARLRKSMLGEPRVAADVTGDAHHAGEAECRPIHD